MPEWDQTEFPQNSIATIVEFLQDAVINRTLDGSVISWNRAAERMFGHTAQEMIGKPISMIFPVNRRTEQSEVLERIRGGECIEQLETQCVRNDGRIVDVLMTACPVRNPAGNVVGLSMILADLAERRRLPKAERAQLLLAAIVSAADEAIISKDLNGIVTSWNKAAEKLFGYTAEDMVGKSISLLIPANRPDEEEHILEQVRAGERIEHFETQRVRKDGRLVDVSLTVSPIKDKLGHVVGASKIARDIGDRKRWEKAELDQLFLAAIVNSADDAIIGNDLDGTVTSWNRGAERLFGYTSAEMVGQSITKIVPAERSEEEPHVLERIRHGERVEHYDTERVGKDGRSLSVSLTVSPIKERMGRVIGASQIVRDISERKRGESAEAAQSFLGALVESAEDAIVSKTLDGVVTSWNPAAEKLFGYSAAEMIGKPIAILIPADHPDEEPQILGRIRRGERIEHYQTRRVRKDGRIIDISLTVSPIKDRMGHIIGASKIARDVTQQKLSEDRERRALRQAEIAKHEAERASQAKDEFLATISHELRTPLTAILGWTSMLASGQLNPQAQQKALEAVDRNARSQAQLIEDLLDISRIVAGKLRLDVKLVDMAAVIASAVDSVRPAAEAKRILIQTVLSSGAGPVFGDFDRLQQVLWNLLSNAIRFTPRDGLVKIELERFESQIELRVSDNGLGISADFLPHIFNRFTQADSSITRSHSGLGMGLAIVKSIVELHGGVVRAASAGENKGAVFTVKLPISSIRQLPTEAESPKPSVTPALRERQELVGLKILVVDDQPDARELLRFIFNQCGAIVETAGGAAEALQMFDRWKPDLLVSDIGMQDTDGYELMRILRQERRSRVPAVALTAMARIEDRMKALSAGYQMHVSKPIEPLELISIVAGLVGFVDRQHSE